MLDYFIYHFLPGFMTMRGRSNITSVRSCPEADGIEYYIKTRHTAIILYDL